MNIFFLHFSPRVCALYHLDRHVVKMIIEYAQLLCTALHVMSPSGVDEYAFYKSTHVNHPSAVWARANIENWKWLKELALELCVEYTYRYRKIHSIQEKIRKLPEPSLSVGAFFPPTPAMPDEYKVYTETNNNTIDSLSSYRKYYKYGKKHLHNTKWYGAWTNRDVPEFITEDIIVEE